MTGLNEASPMERAAVGNNVAKRKVHQETARWNTMEAQVAVTTTRGPAEQEEVVVGGGLKTV